MQDFKTMRDMCAEQEEKFQFERFSRRDALNIGLKLIENAEKQAQNFRFCRSNYLLFRCVCWSI